MDYYETIQHLSLVEVMQQKYNSIVKNGTWEIYLKEKSYHNKMVVQNKTINGQGLRHGWWCLDSNKRNG